MFRKEVGLNRWLNVSGVTWANWLPRSLCSETLAIFSWQQPHAGACTFASKHIGRLDSKNMQKWYHLKNRFGKSIKKNNGSIATNQGPLNHDESCFFSGHIGSSLPHLYSWAEWRHGMGWDSSMAWKKHSSVPFGKKSGFPTTSNNKPAKIGESTGFMANFGYVSGIICGLCYPGCFLKSHKAKSGHLVDDVANGPGGPNFLVLAIRRSPQRPGFPWKHVVAWKHLRTFENLIIS